MRRLTIAEKIIIAHIPDEYKDKIIPENRGTLSVPLKVDQTLTQDATGTMAYLQLEALFDGVPNAGIKTEKSVAYIDHNTLQSGFMNADDHAFIASAAKKFGVWFSRPGNGICHQVHLERFARPGITLIGSDSHTPTAGGVGALAMGAGGFDVAAAMAGARYHITLPKIVRIELTGELRPWVSAKDVILKVLSILSVKGGVGKIVEYSGPGVAGLSVPERATITNMGAELGATTSIFPSDGQTEAFLKRQGRASDYASLAPDDGAVYDEVYTIDLCALEPLVACPHSPDSVKPVAELAGMPVSQVSIGSCTNSSLYDLLKVAHILRGKTVAENVSLSIAPGSKQVLSTLAAMGELQPIIDAGARILEAACGPCIGMGQSPKSAGISLRTFNRNFLGRSGTADAGVYLLSPEVAALSAVTGVLSDPTELAPAPEIKEKSETALFLINDNMIAPPAENGESVTIEKGPNIKEYPVGKPMSDSLTLAVSLKTGDNITTDHIMPAGSKILPYRSNIPHLSQYCFEVVDAGFPARAKELGQSVIVGGENYGQGSSREHAALVPLYLGVRVVIAKSFARIHADNLVNSGILPLTFADAADYDTVAQGNIVELCGLLSEAPTMRVNGREIQLVKRLSERQERMIQLGGALGFVRSEIAVCRS